MKKIFSILLALALTFGLCACDATPAESNEISGELSSSEVEVSDGDETLEDEASVTSTREPSKKTKASKSTSISKSKTMTATRTNITSMSESSTTKNKTETTQTTTSTTAATEHDHEYEIYVTLATCSEGGFSEYRCSCGDFYLDDFTQPTYDHNFKEAYVTFEKISYDTYQCSHCKLEVAAYGNADGTTWESWGKKAVKYYVERRMLNVNGRYEFGDYHIVVYGNGEMPHYSKGTVPWSFYTDYANKVTIAEGVTSITTYSFWIPEYYEAYEVVEFNMADTVKVIERNAINLKMKTLVVGKGVERIEGTITDKNTKALYLPRTLKYFEPIGSSWYSDTTIYFEGTKAEFLNVKTTSYNQTVAIRQVMYSWALDGMQYCHVYLNCSKLYDRSEYFNAVKEWK